MSNQTFKEYLTEQQEEQNLIANMKADGFNPSLLTEATECWIPTSIAELRSLNEEITRLQNLGTPEAILQLEALCD